MTEIERELALDSFLRERVGKMVRCRFANSPRKLKECRVVLWFGDILLKPKHSTRRIKPTVLEDIPSDYVNPRIVSYIIHNRKEFVNEHSK